MQTGPKPFLTPQQFEYGAIEYMKSLEESGNKPTITGLALHLGFASKQSVYDYRKREGYEHVAARAVTMIENSYEQQLANGRGDGGVVFALKNFGWTDKQEIQHSEKVTDSGDNEW